MASDDMDRKLEEAVQNQYTQSSDDHMLDKDYNKE